MEDIDIASSPSYFEPEDVSIRASIWVVMSNFYLRDGYDSDDPVHATSSANPRAERKKAIFKFEPITPTRQWSI